jgi:membrane-associated protein
MTYVPHGELEYIVRLVGYPGLFAAVFAETGIFFMFFLPGASMLFTAGLLASHGFFNVWILAPLITIAAILGDSAGYWFGSQVGHKLYKREDSRFFKKSYLIKTRDFYERHGVRAIVFARFVPIVRTFAPILAGVAEMKYRTFFTYNVVGAVLWGAGVTFGGYFLGTHVPGADKYFTAIIVGIIFATFIPLIIEWYKHRAKNNKPTTDV